MRIYSASVHLMSKKSRFECCDAIILALKGPQTVYLKHQSISEAIRAGKSGAVEIDVSNPNGECAEARAVVFPGVQRHRVSVACNA